MNLKYTYVPPVADTGNQFQLAMVEVAYVLAVAVPRDRNPHQEQYTSAAEEVVEFREA